MEEDSHGQGALLQVPTPLPGLLGDPGRSRVLGTAGEQDPPGAHLDEEEHVDRPEQGRLHREEIRCEDLLSVVAEEGPPGVPLTGTLRRRWHVRTLEQVAAGRASHPLAELA